MFLCRVNLLCDIKTPLCRLINIICRETSEHTLIQVCPTFQAYRPSHSGKRWRLAAGHKKVRLSSDELERLITWMDTTALFYGTFNPEDQARQRKGERIEGPDLE